jgi:hypothetical protein
MAARPASWVNLGEVAHSGMSHKFHHVSLTRKGTIEPTTIAPAITIVKNTVLSAPGASSRRPSWRSFYPSHPINIHPLGR